MSTQDQALKPKNQNKTCLAMTGELAYIRCAPFGNAPNVEARKHRKGTLWRAFPNGEAGKYTPPVASYGRVGRVAKRLRLIRTCARQIWRIPGSKKRSGFLWKAIGDSTQHRHILTRQIIKQA